MRSLSGAFILDVIGTLPKPAEAEQFLARIESDQAAQLD